MGMSGRLLLSLCALCVAGTGLGPVAAAAEVPVLGGETVLVGDTTAYAVVDIADPWDWYHATAEGTGGGLLRGMRIEPDAGQAGPSVEAYSVAAGHPDGRFGNGSRGGGGGLAPAGHYRIYLFADGQPARVTFRIPNLTGKVTIAPARPVSVDAQEITTVGTDGRESWSAGRVTTRSTSTVIYYESYSFAPGQQGDYAFCHKLPGADTSDDSFRRPCGQDPLVERPEVLWSSSGSDYTTGSFTNFPKLGTYGFGGWARVRSGDPARIGGKVWAIHHVTDAPSSSPPAAPAPPPSSTPTPTPTVVPQVAAPAPVPPRATTLLLQLRCIGADRCTGQARLVGADAVRYSIAPLTSARVRVPMTRAQRARLRAGRTATGRLVLRSASGATASRGLRIRPTHRP